MKDLIEKIKHHEGFVGHVYKCTEGFDTIGYGFAIKDLVIPEHIAEELLILKLEKLQKNANSRSIGLKMCHKKSKKLCLICVISLALTEYQNLKGLKSHARR